MPHIPLGASEKFKGKSAGGFYGDTIEEIDWSCGEILKTLKQLDLDDNTLVIFTSDNGPHNEGGHNHETFDSNGPLKGFKRSMHEGGIRVPMIVRWPGRIKPGTSSPHPSAFYDFLPTACEIAGVEPPKQIDGISYLPTLVGQVKKQQRHENLYWAGQEGATSVGVRMGDWKLVQYREKKKGKKTAKSETPPAKPMWRLYNLSEAIGEENEISDKQPEIVKQILAKLRRDELL